MSMSPNDPDYAKIMKAHRDSVPSERAKAKKRDKNINRNLRERRRSVN